MVQHKLSENGDYPDALYMCFDQDADKYCHLHQDGAFNNQIRYKTYKANQAHFGGSLAAYNNELFTVGGLYQNPRVSMLEWSGTRYSFVTRETYPYAQ